MRSIKDLREEYIRETGLKGGEVGWEPGSGSEVLYNYSHFWPISWEENLPAQGRFSWAQDQGVWYSMDNYYKKGWDNCLKHPTLRGLIDLIKVMEVMER